jgi:hypothetical protein
MPRFVARVLIAQQYDSDYYGIVHALVFPCHKDGAQWVDTSNKKHVDIQPTHWRKWTESH